jgi:hypothetical protein
MSDMPDDDPLGIQTLRQDPKTGIDLAQLEYNLSLTVDQRLEQYFQWMEFVEILREASRKHYGMDLRPPPDPEWTGD